jgi:HEAT repeat protein
MKRGVSWPPRRGGHPARRPGRLQEGSLAPYRARLLHEEPEEEGPCDWAQALSDPRVTRRHLGLEVLCHCSREHAMPVLIGMMSDPEPDVRLAAIASAGALGARRLVSCLIVALDDPAPSVRAASLRALEALLGCKADERDLHDPRRRQELILELRAGWKRQRIGDLLAGT